MANVKPRDLSQEFAAAATEDLWLRLQQQQQQQQQQQHSSSVSRKETAAGGSMGDINSTCWSLIVLFSSLKMW